MTTEVEETDESALVAHARSELLRAGLFGPESDYDGAIGGIVLGMVQAFASYGHSGGSAEMALEVFDRVVRFQPLGPITNNPEEWMLVTYGVDEGDPPLYQSRRQSSLFSNDGGKTYYDINQNMNPDGTMPIHESKEHTSA